MFKSDILSIRKVRFRSNIKCFEFFGQPTIYHLPNPNSDVAKLKFLERSKAHKISDWLSQAERFELDCAGLAKSLSFILAPLDLVIKSQIKLVWCFIYLNCLLTVNYQTHGKTISIVVQHGLKGWPPAKKENRVETFLSHWCKMGYHTKLTNPSPQYITLPTPIVC